MATLERRVQVLFDPAEYAELEAEAAATHQSVGALIREAVSDRLDRRQRTAQEALERFFASGDESPTRGPIDWEAEKDAFEYRHYPHELP